MRGVACATASEALALFRHLAWWVLDEAEFSAGHQPAYDIAMARAKDLSLYLSTFTGPAPIPQAAPSGRLAAYFPRRGVPVIDLRSRVSADAPEDEEAPGGIYEWEAVSPVRPDGDNVHAGVVVDGFSALGRLALRGDLKGVVGGAVGCDGGVKAERLATLARLTIHNDHDDQTAVFARELLAMVER